MLVTTCENKMTFMGCTKIALMRRDDVNCILALARLISLYGCTIQDYFEHLEYLCIVLKVCQEEYCTVLDDFRLGSEKIIGA